MMSETSAVLEWDLADRMRKALRVSGRSVQEMADYLGVAPTTVSTWINGRNRPSPSTIRLWAMRCEVPYEWLLGDPVRTAPIRSVLGTECWRGRHHLCYAENCRCLCHQPADYDWSDGDDDGEALSLCRSVLGLAA